MGNLGSIYTSSDSGLTWSSNSAPVAAWNSVASSADGGKLTAAINGGGIYTLQTLPPLRLRAVAANGGIGLSWLVPSTNYFLRQISNLNASAWTTVAGQPALNLTNLQNEVTLPTAAGGGFFRLATP